MRAMNSSQLFRWSKVPGSRELHVDRTEVNLKWSTVEMRTRVKTHRFSKQTSNYIIDKLKLYLFNVNMVFAYYHDVYRGHSFSYQVFQTHALFFVVVCLFVVFFKSFTACPIL